MYIIYLTQYNYKIYVVDNTGDDDTAPLILTFLYRYIQVYTGIHRYIQVYIQVYRLYTGIYRYCYMYNYINTTIEKMVIIASLLTINHYQWSHNYV